MAGIITSLAGIQVGSFESLKIKGFGIWELIGVSLRLENVNLPEMAVKENILAFEGSIDDGKFLISKALGNGLIYWDKCFVNDKDAIVKVAMFVSVPKTGDANAIKCS